MITYSDNIKAMQIAAANKRIDRLVAKGIDAYKVLGINRKLSTHKVLIDADFEKAQEILNNPASSLINYHKEDM